MNKINSVLGQLFHEEDGQSLIEYSLIGAIVGIGTIAAMIYMRTSIYNLFVTIGASLHTY